MPVELANRAVVGSEVTAVVEVDRGGFGGIEAVELGQGGTAASVVLHVDHREVDFTVAPDDLEVVIANRERVAAVVQAIPEHGMVARQGHAGHRAIADVGRVVVVEAVGRRIASAGRAAPDDDFVGEGIEGGEGEHAARGHRRVGSAHVADEGRHGELRLQRNLRYRKGCEHAIDLAGVRPRGRDIAEKHRIGRAFGRHAGAE